MDVVGVGVGKCFTLVDPKRKFDGKSKAPEVPIFKKYGDGYEARVKGNDGYQHRYDIQLKGGDGDLKKLLLHESGFNRDLSKGDAAAEALGLRLVVKSFSPRKEAFVLKVEKADKGEKTRGKYKGRKLVFVDDLDSEKGKLSAGKPVIQAWGSTSVRKRVTELGDPALIDVKDVKGKGLDKGLKKTLNKLVKLCSKPWKITGDDKHCILDDLVAKYLNPEGTNICNVVVTYKDLRAYKGKILKRGTILHMAVNSLAYCKSKDASSRSVIAAFIQRAGKQYGAVYGPVEQGGKNGQFYNEKGIDPLDVLLKFHHDYDMGAIWMDDAKPQVGKVAKFFHDFYGVKPTPEQVDSAEFTLGEDVQLYLVRLAKGEELPVL